MGKVQELIPLCDWKHASPPSNRKPPFPRFRPPPSENERVTRVFLHGKHWKFAEAILAQITRRVAANVLVFQRMTWETQMFVSAICKPLSSSEEPRELKGSDGRLEMQVQFGVFTRIRTALKQL